MTIDMVCDGRTKRFSCASRLLHDKFLGLDGACRAVEVGKVWAALSIGFTTGVLQRSSVQSAVSCPSAPELLDLRFIMP